MTRDDEKKRNYFKLMIALLCVANAEENKHNNHVAVNLNKVEQKLNYLFCPRGESRRNFLLSGHCSRLQRSAFFVRGPRDQLFEHVLSHLRGRSGRCEYLRMRFQFYTRPDSGRCEERRQLLLACFSRIYYTKKVEISATLYYFHSWCT